MKPKTKHHPALTSGRYAYGEVLQIIAEISNTTFQKSKKTVKKLKLIG